MKAEPAWDDGSGSMATRDGLLRALVSELDTYGGPMQYLEKNVADAAGFASELQAMLGSRDDVPYLEKWSAEVATNTDIFLHVWDLGHNVKCTTKMPPYKKTAVSLLDEYLTHGFVTEGSCLISTGLPIKHCFSS